MSFWAGGSHTGMIPSIEPLPADEAAFTALAEQHRRELHLHCYRMLASVQDAEDAVQETFLRAWRSRETFAGRSTFRAWLYRIATNAALDIIGRRPSVPSVTGNGNRAFEVPWLEPYPESLLVAAAAEEPEAVAVSRETIELAFIVAVQQLPPQGRAALLLRDVLGWSAADSATLLDVSVAALNSSLQRARAVLQETSRRTVRPGAPSTRGRSESSSSATSMPMSTTTRSSSSRCWPKTRAGRCRRTRCRSPGVHGCTRRGEGGIGTAEFGELRCVVTRANGQPAVGVYRRREGEEVYRPLAIDVLRMADGVVAEILTFVPGQFAALGLPGAPC